MITLKTKVNEINRIGMAVAGRLRRLNIKTVEDILWHLPFRYDDFSNMAKIDELIPDQPATIQGTIELLSSRRARNRKLTLTEALVTDDTGSIKVIWFNQPYISKMFKKGDQIILAGKVTGELLAQQMSNPSYEKVKEITTHTGRLVPIYSTTEKLTQKQIRFIAQSCLPALEKMTDWLPEKIREDNELIDLAEALEQIHFPENELALKAAQERLQFNEIFLLQLQQQMIKNALQENNAPSLPFKKDEIQEFVNSLPFTLTPDQKKAGWEIIQNMESKSPMNRLLDGDVGSGKTVVAILAAYSAIINSFQVALMAPTTILAQQHIQTIKKLLPDKKITYCLLTLKDSILYKDGEEIEMKKKELLEYIKEGKVDFIVGTHALIQKTVEYNNLGLVIIDEQHRFGVDQRKALRDKSGDPATMPHFLSMTATPIPRTLALALYGDLDISLIKSLPSGRQKIITKIIPPVDRTKSYEFINSQIEEGRQVFVICPLIDPSDKLGVKSVTEEYEHLDKEVFPHLNIGLLHGKLKPEEKTHIMEQFKNNEIKILVSTSVVEVGVDVPNATVMMIEGADRFGLAQLHQFRGRVGRGEYQSYCYLFTDSDTPKTISRLKALVDNYDGFALAERDLKFRGGGNIYGTAQSGFDNQFIINALQNVVLLKQAQTAAQEILKLDPKLEHFPKLKKKMDKILEKTHME
ncbi:MAG: ATP-dependent DNA helicase RecG [Candidatus Komeilibacteria bacterium]